MPNLAQIVTELEARRNQVRQELGRLDTAIAALRGSGSRDGSKPGLGGTPLRRTMSAAARRKISQAKKAWWAKKNSKPTSAPAKPALSLVARRKIAAAQRARWARVKAKQGNAA